VGHYKESAPFLKQYERLFRKHGVDMVFSGHVHAYERTNPVFNYTRDDCGPMYTTIGDGGNIEGLVYPFIDTPPPPDFCANTSLFELPSYQPTPSGQPLITLQHGRFCPTRQPGWSAFRQPSFGHGGLSRGPGCNSRGSSGSSSRSGGAATRCATAAGLASAWGGSQARRPFARQRCFCRYSAGRRPVRLWHLSGQPAPS
jgi:hypothetical protein